MISATTHIDQVDDKARISHILYCIERIEASTKEINFDTFLSNKILRTAVSKWLEIMGEASVHITEETKDRNNGIKWREMIDLGNHILTEYFEINYDRVWDAISNLSDLTTKLEAINRD